MAVTTSLKNTETSPTKFALTTIPRFSDGDTFDKEIFSSHCVRRVLEGKAMRNCSKASEAVYDKWRQSDGFLNIIEALVNATVSLF
ncbi:hypothetical protein K0M31_002082 [Melipona bicolor]|uniref:Uncharacterized protein n=1 Tax=Melipona bicolor TaxID=60889 RepID=A0AA40GGT0_9HYME|nr:hypothetical protein K0M31_002082 [Melipona bicolor]